MKQPDEDEDLKKIAATALAKLSLKQPHEDEDLKSVWARGCFGRFVPLRHRSDGQFFVYDAVGAEKRKKNKWKKRAMDMSYFNGDEKLLPRWAKYAKTQDAEWEAMASEWNDFATRGEGAASGSGGEGAPAPASPRGPEHRAPVDIAPATRDWATSGCGGEGAPAPAPNVERPVGVS